MNEPSSLLPPKKRERPHLGHAIRDGKFRYTSAKQITLFDKESTGGCPRKFAYEYLLGKKPPRTEAQQKGANFAEILEHYLTTGEDILPPVLREAKRFLPTPGPDLSCEQPLGEDIARAVLLRDALNCASEGVDREALVRGIRRLAGISVCDIPIEGAADFKHRRGIYVDADGFTRKEEPSHHVAYIGDLKTPSRIWNETIRGGKVLTGYALTDYEATATPQMLTYAMCELLQRPDTTHIRLQHVYAQKIKRGATVRGGLVSAEEIRRRWRRIEGVVSEMVDTVARTKTILDVEPNYDACDAYTHVGPDGKSAPGCAHQSYCPRAVQEVVSNLLGKPKEIGMGMSLFESIANPNPGQNPGSTSSVPPPPLQSPPPPPDSAEYQAKVEQEKQKLLSESQAPPPPVIEAPKSPKPTKGDKMPVTACDPDHHYFVDCGDGEKPRVMEYKGSSRGKHFFVDKLGWRTVLDSDASVWEALGAASAAPLTPTVNIGQVVPPDAPIPTLLESAAPLPPEVVARIEDLELKAKVEAHNQAHAERNREMEAQAEKTSGRCPAGKQTLPLSVEVAMSKKAVCGHCGEERRVKVDAATKTFFFPGHNLPDVIEATAKAQIEVVNVAPANGINGHTVVEEEDEGGDEVLPGQEPFMFAAPPPPSMSISMTAPPPPAILPTMPTMSTLSMPPLPIPPLSFSDGDAAAIRQEFLRIWAEVYKMVEGYLKAAKI